MIQSLKNLLSSQRKKIKIKQIPEEQYKALSALKCRVWYNQYGGYCLPESSLHRSAARRVLRGDVYEPATLEFMRAHCGEGDIVHAGTYFGDFLPALASGCGANSEVWAFEPNPENYRCAQITCLINALNNVHLQNAGLGDELAELYMRTVDTDGRSMGGKSRIIAQEDYDEARDEKIRITCIDEAVPVDRNVSIVQLDVEDHEKAALTGALQTIKRCLPILILEVRKESDLLDSAWFADTILSLGYKQTDTVHGNVVFRCPHDK
ncbi:MAG: FkbM family methyltransferase [Halioglobus sp.]